MSYSTFFPVAFPALAIAHFLALITPGQDFFLIVAHSIRYRLKGSRFICLGVALGNALYIGISIFGLMAIRNNQVIYLVVEVVGGVWLLWLGSMLLRSKKQGTDVGFEQIPVPTALKQLVLGFNSAILNPKNALFYMSLMTVMLGNEVTLTQQVSCGLWMFCAVLLWDLFVATVIGQTQVQTLLSNYIHVVERLAGLAIVFVGLSLFIGYLEI
ncbi:LysE family translocator [Vibrio sp. SCSIO 43136]|uniref:LysE family translocator n=1 Tax=Vibrio sp. SCSIO 43136 TaxID=2819101 RepID=UPI002075B42F|nr:LysE family translocator [Vibrio sp. SCSIO 43136]USD66139.1 LysE family translocator [Vibrio sp. SCSIO 43136]